MVGKVGDDAYGPALLENLKRAGVDTAAMAQVEPAPRAGADVCRRDGENSIVVVPGANGKMDRAASTATPS
jgi:ribokinase